MASTPVVADVNGDGVGDILFVTYPSGPNGQLRALSGDDGGELFTVTNPAQDLATNGQLGVGDLDGDGKPEIVGVAYGNVGVIAFSNTGVFKWRSPTLSNYAATVSLTRVSAEGPAVVLAGNSLLNGSDGSIRITFPAFIGSTPAFSGNHPIAADLDGDGVPEFINCATAYRLDGSLYFYQAGIYPAANCTAAVANFDESPAPEIVVGGGVGTALLNNDGSMRWFTSFFSVGFLSVADLDGDGWPEIAASGADGIHVLSREGKHRWVTPISGLNNVIGGCSAFDFDGDGAAEIVTGDPNRLLILRGRDGAKLAERPLGTCPSASFPVVADVDGDGRAEIVGGRATWGCSGVSPGSFGVYVIDNPSDAWRNARPVWNQLSYRVTNVGDDGRLPFPETPVTLGPNSFRSQRQSEGHASGESPDVTASFVRRDVVASQVRLTVRVGNGGSSPARVGVGVAFYDGEPAAGQLLGLARTSQDLDPGQFEDVALERPGGTPSEATVWVVADDEGDLSGRTRECDEGNNRVDSGLRLNQKPVADAGGDQVTSLPQAVVTVAGSATDDDLPPAAALTYAWSKRSGPGDVTFQDAASASTTASFGVAGTYELLLDVSDSVLHGTDTVTVTVSPPNQAPTVDAGPDQDITWPPTNSATLAGSVSDDGLPSGHLAVSWSQVSGPAPVVFGTPSAPVTTVTVQATGIYVLRLTASDGVLEETPRWS